MKLEGFDLQEHDSITQVYHLRIIWDSYMGIHAFPSHVPYPLIYPYDSLCNCSAH